MDAASLYPMNINWRYYELEAFFAACAEHGFSSAELWLCPQHFLITDLIVRHQDSFAESVSPIIKKDLQFIVTDYDRLPFHHPAPRFIPSSMNCFT